MNKFMWILGVTCLGAAAYVLLSDRAGSDYGIDNQDDFGTKAGAWGTKNRVFGAGGVLGGKAEQGLGELTNDPAVKGKGYLDEAVGTVKNAAGKAAQAVSDTIADAKS